MVKTKKYERAILPEDKRFLSTTKYQGKMTKMEKEEKEKQIPWKR